MANVEIIKANKSDRIVRGKKIDILKVAAYCRVSTDTEDQLNSYKSQVAYYTDLINKNPEWELVDIYADQAITGTMVNKRDDFQRMINDCLNGKINMIITKSISRFARNTLDTLKYVRLLKEKNVAVQFEDEHINTLTMDGELMLVILSSVAQQEVENISANVKKGIRMKHSRGEITGFAGCLGYDWIPETKSLIINKEEAEIVKYIFDRYISGIGSDTIAKELEALGHQTKKNGTKWSGSTVMGIIKNEKYCGDVLLGKTYTISPITKKRLKNYGEEDRFYIKDHHEPIISREAFELAEKIRRSRNVNRGEYTDGAPPVRKCRYTRQYNFSSMLKCGYCGSVLVRRRWHMGTSHSKVVWQCSTSAKNGKRNCPCSKGIEETAIENAFLKSYQLLYSKDNTLVEEFIENARAVLLEDDSEEILKLSKNKLQKNKVQKENLLNLKLNGLIDDDAFAEKNLKLSQRISSLENRIEHLENKKEGILDVEKRLSEFRNSLEEGTVIDEFSREIFESVIDYVVVGGYDETGEVRPDMLTFIYKAGQTSKLNGKDFKGQRKNAAASYIMTEKTSIEGYVEILRFEQYHKHNVFIEDVSGGLRKMLKHSIDVSVGVVA